MACNPVRAFSFDIFSRILPTVQLSALSLSVAPLQPPAESRAEHVESVQRDNAQGDRDRLLQADGSGDGRTAEDDGGQEAELDAIRLVVLDLVAAKGICIVC